MVVFLFRHLEQRRGVHPATPLSIRHTELCVQCGSCVQVPELLSDIEVPSIISQKTRHIGSKLIKYWPTSKMLEIHYTDVGPMQPICCFQIVLLDGQIELSRQLEQWSGCLIIPRSNLIMLCELNQHGLISENAQ